MLDTLFSFFQNDATKEKMSVSTKIAAIDIERQNRLSSLNHDNNSIFYRKIFKRDLRYCPLELSSISIKFERERT